ncbi:MAG: hypothetical protein IPL43_02940 [Micropruina sp.]|nr:hypothetical protein [Micropruina sp.]
MSAEFAELVGSVLPVLLIIALGMGLRRTSLLSDSLVAGLTHLVVAVALPALLFTTFLTTQFKPGHVWIIVMVFTVCVLLLGVGYIFRLLTRGSTYSPFLFTGFELGMIGFALFTAVYGVERLPALGVLALGHELFVWFIFVSLLRATAHESPSLSMTLRNLATSPVIVAILSGLLFNALGWGPAILTSPLSVGVMTTLRYLAGIIVPLVLLIVGYGSRLTVAGVREALPLVLTRLTIAVGLALLLNAFVVRGVLGLDPIFEAGLFTLMVLPPPFIVPLFIPADRREDISYANNVLSLYSLASVGVFVAYVMLS